MTQADAKNAVNQIKLKLIRLMGTDVSEDDIDESLESLLTDIKHLEQSLSVRHFLSAPNCRPATPAELRQLCAASNVVVFPAA